jgi:hypothetical protein
MRRWTAGDSRDPKRGPWRDSGIYRAMGPHLHAIYLMMAHFSSLDPSQKFQSVLSDISLFGVS